MRRFSFLIYALCPLMALGCGKMVEPKAPAGGPVAEQATETPAEITPPEESTVDIGTIEYNMHIATLIADADVPEGATAEGHDNQRRVLSLFTAAVPAPAPDELWVSTQISYMENLRDLAVVYQGTLFKKVNKGEAEEIEKFSGILTRDNAKDKSAGTRVNIMDGVDASAVSEIQAYAHVKLLLLPKDTDLSSVDPATVTVDRADQGFLQSNPAQITFK